MADKIDRDEIREMIDDIIKSRVNEAVNESLEKFMLMYGLKPQHWVYLDSEYTKSMNRQGIVRKIILTAIVTAISVATMKGGEDWIRKIVLEANRKTEQTSDMSTGASHSRNP